MFSGIIRLLSAFCALDSFDKKQLKQKSLEISLENHFHSIYIFVTVSVNDFDSTLASCSLTFFLLILNILTLSHGPGVTEFL